MTTVLYSSPFIPPEWIAACGHRPMRVLPHLPARPAVGVRTGMCPYARAFVNSAIEDVGAIVMGGAPRLRRLQPCCLGNIEDTAADNTAVAPNAAIVVATTCDQMRRVAELIDGWHGHSASCADDHAYRPPNPDVRKHGHSQTTGADHATPMFVFNVPATWQTPGVHRYYRDELWRLGRWLVRLGGRLPAPVELAAVMIDYDDRRQQLRDARGSLSARAWSEAVAESFFGTGVSPVHGWHGHSASFADDHAYGRPGQATSAISHCRSVSMVIPTPMEGIGLGSDHATPLALVGGPLMAADFGIFDLIERCGGEVVLDATESGELSLPRPFDRRRLDDDPLGELADAYFGSMPAVFRRPDSELYLWLREHLARRGARGMIVRHYIWCDLWHAAAGRLADWGECPVLNVQVDAEEHDSARLAGRIQAFVEMLR